MRNHAQSGRDCTSCPQPTWFFSTGLRAEESNMASGLWLSSRTFQQEKFLHKPQGAVPAILLSLGHGHEWGPLALIFTETQNDPNIMAFEMIHVCIYIYIYVFSYIYIYHYYLLLLLFALLLSLLLSLLLFSLL